MAKPMLVTLPFVLLLLDYWPLGRLQGAGSGKRGALETVAGSTEREAGSAKQNIGVKREALSANKKKGESGKKREPSPNPRQTSRGMELEEKPAAGKYRWASVRPLLIEKMPFFAMAAISSVVTFFVQQKGGAVASFEGIAPGVRIANAFVSYIIYIRKTFWPTDLAVYYPHPGLWPLWQVLGAIFFLGVVTLTVIWTAKSLPYLAVGWLWFAGTLVPVIGIVQVGGQALADRYTYIPLIGLFIMAAWGIPELLEKWRYQKETLFASSALLLLSLLIVTRTQVGYWRNSIALYDQSLKVTGPSEIILSNRGAVYNELGNHRQAISDFDRAIEIDPNFSDAYGNRGFAYDQLGNLQHAISDYNRAIEINPEYADAYHNRGMAYGKLGNVRQAISDYDRAVEINPEFAGAYNNRGAVYGMLGNNRQAISDFDRAIEIDPNFSNAYGNRGAAYDQLGNLQHAISDYNRAIEINPEYADAYHNRGIAYGKLGNNGQAVEDMKTAARLNNEDAKNILRSHGINW